MQLISSWARPGRAAERTDMNARRRARSYLLFEVPTRAQVLLVLSMDRSLRSAARLSFQLAIVVIYRGCQDPARSALRRAPVQVDSSAHHPASRDRSTPTRRPTRRTRTLSPEPGRAQDAVVVSNRDRPGSKQRRGGPSSRRGRTRFGGDTARGRVRPCTAANPN